MVRTPTPFTVFQKRFPQLSKTPPVIEMHWIQFLLTSEDTLWPDSSKIMCILYSWILLSNEWSSQFTETEFKLLRTFISNLTFFRGGGEAFVVRKAYFYVLLGNVSRIPVGGSLYLSAKGPQTLPSNPALKFAKRTWPNKKIIHTHLYLVKNTRNSFKRPSYFCHFEEKTKYLKIL